VKACGGERIVERTDVDSEEGQALAVAYGVALIPAFVSVDSSGREVTRLTGVQTQRRLEQAIEEVLGTRCASIDSTSDAEPM
jgi:thioredoxin-like negative regulator of GroEL